MPPFGVAVVGLELLRVSTTTCSDGLLKVKDDGESTDYKLLAADQMFSSCSWCHVHSLIFYCSSEQLTLTVPQWV